MVSIISFFIIRLSPVDPLAELKLNPSISPETVKKEKERLGLDKPIIVQYGKWAVSFVKGDLGVTSSGEKVSRKLQERIPYTLLLTSIVILLTWFVGVPLGIIAAVNWKTPFDRILTVLTSIGMAIPSFFFAVLLLMFAVKTGWFPVGGLTSPDFADMSLGRKFLDIAYHLVLPVTVAMSRLEERTEQEHFEQQEFLENVQKNYLARAAEDPERFVLVDADRDAETILDFAEKSIRAALQ